VLERIRAPQPWWEVLGEWAWPSVARRLGARPVGGFLLGRLIEPQRAELATGPAIGLKSRRC
jgi:hypothetical protein